MLGAIIGDLAAWTWERDPALFYRRLIAPDAQISEVGLAVLGLSEPMLRWPSDFEWEALYKHIGGVFQKANVGLLPPTFRDWLQAGYHTPIPERVKQVMLLVIPLVGGWCNAFDRNGVDRERIVVFSRKFHGNKEEHYLSQLADVIYRLRQGATKHEAMEGVLYIKDGSLLDPETPLGYAYHAWECFEKSWDFTSALHNAMRCPYGDKHLLAALTWAIAEVMYSCEYGFIKQKYSLNNDIRFEVSIPEELGRSYRDELALISSHKDLDRVFFPKNRALTNVERWLWFDLPNIFVDRPLRAEEYQRIRLSHDTGWEARYGIYLDDGWYYVYRSEILLNRFLIEQATENTYRISRVQYCRNHPQGKTYQALVEAFREDGLDMSDCSLINDYHLA